MADLTCKMAGIEFQNPIIVASCDFGGDIDICTRTVKMRPGGLITKTIHKIPGIHTWPRPCHYSLRRFGKELNESWVCSQMFSQIPYEQWIDHELPAMAKVCKQNGVRLIGNISAVGDDLSQWTSAAKDVVSCGVDMLELNTGGPHATFGADAGAQNVGAIISLNPELAAKIVKAVIDAVPGTPVMVKMTPQNTNTGALALALEKIGTHAISANNAFYGVWVDHETGGFFGVPAFMGFLAGRAWQPLSLAKMIEVTATVKTDVSAIGGIFTAEDVARFIMAGASTAQLCSVLYSRGIGVIPRLLKDLEAFMDRKGYKTVESMKGLALKELTYLRDIPREKIMSKISPIKPVFASEKCPKGCQICERVCPYGAITKSADGKPAADDKCIGCGWCLGNCPHEVVQMVEVATGKPVWDGTGNMRNWVSESGA
jgi:dihydropyrimidine dehydrogenase (NAD+) subunit PreA